MAIPTRSKQEQFISDLLDKGAEGAPLESFAKKIVDMFHDVLMAEIKTMGPPLHEGVAFKSAFTTQVHFVGKILGDRVWIINEKSHYGWFGPMDSPYWKYTEESPDRRKKDVDLPRPGSPGNNPDYQVGDRLFVSQGRAHLEVVATGDKCVLLRDVTSGDVYPDSNENLKRYYRRERD